MQTDYAAELAHLGIRRGIPRHTTGARHRSAHAYRAEIAEQAEIAAMMTQGTMTGLAETSQAVMTDAVARANATASKIINDAERTAAAFTSGLDAIDQGELVHKPAQGDLPAGLKPGPPVPRPALPQDPEDRGRWQKAVAPLWERLTAYAGRIAGLQARDAALDTEQATIARVVRRQELTEKIGGLQTGPASKDADILQTARRGRANLGRDD